MAIGKRASLVFITLFIILFSLSSIIATPNVTLISPLDNQNFSLINNITFEFSVNDGAGISNISLYHNLTGNFVLNNSLVFGKSELDAQKESGLVLLYHFNNDPAYGENSSLVYDFSGNGNHGTVIGATYNATDGKFNGSYEFPGISDYDENGSIRVEDSDSLDLTTSGTIEAWIRPLPIGNGYSQVLTKGDAWDESSPYSLLLYKITENTGYEIMLMLGNTITGQTLRSSSRIEFDGWHHIAVTWNGSIINLYIDGVLNNSASQTVTPFNSAGVLRIGKNAYSGYAHKGAIDEVAVFKKTLTADEIAIHAGAKSKNITQQWTVNNIPEGNYVWNYFAYSEDGSSSWNPFNYTFTISFTPPTNLKPTADFSYNPNYLSVTFTDLSSDLNIYNNSPINDSISYLWDFGDNTFSTLANISHGYSAAGTYNVSLNVTDNYGLSDKKTAVITVSAQPVGVVSSGGGGGGCFSTWNCSEWSACSADGKQIRTCIDISGCSYQLNKPSEVQSCVYIPKEQEQQNNETLTKTESETARTGAGITGNAIAVTGKAIDGTIDFGKKNAAVILIITILIVFNVIQFLRPKS